MEREIAMGCDSCIRACGVDRREALGYCHLDDGLYIASICRHHGEEPMLGGDAGVCNVFFAHCTLQCPFCQNYQISSNGTCCEPHRMDLDDAIRTIEKHLLEGCRTVGFVTPTSQVDWVVRMVESLRAKGLAPTVVYNTNGLDSMATVNRLAGIVDVYLPDYKYGSYELAQRCAGLRSYPDRALESIRAMVRQVGNGLECNQAGLARRGVLVRHLVLPGEVENSIAALLNLHTEFGAGLALSVMGQYTPTAHAAVCGDAFARPITQEEYGEVLRFAEDLGFETIVCQELESASHYMPDFSAAWPFR